MLVPPALKRDNLYDCYTNEYEYGRYVSKMMKVSLSWNLHQLHEFGQCVR